MSASIVKFTNMCAEFQKAAEAKEAAERGSSPAVPAPGGPSIVAIPEADISAENGDVDLSDGDTGAGAGQKNLLAARAVANIGTGGEDSEENRRQLKIQCTEAGKSARNALAATGVATTGAAPSSG